MSGRITRATASTSNLEPSEYTRLRLAGSMTLETSKDALLGANGKYYTYQGALPYNAVAQPDPLSGAWASVADGSNYARMTKDPEAYGAVYGDSTLATRQLNSKVLKDILIDQGGDLFINLSGDLHLAAGSELPVKNLCITGGRLFTYSGNYFILTQDGSSHIEDTELHAIGARTRLVMTAEGVNTYIRFMTASNFKAFGIITIYRSRVDQTFPTDPLTFSFGVGFMLIDSFYIENASDALFNIDDSPCRVASFTNFNMRNVSGSPFIAGTFNDSPYEKNASLSHELVIFNNYKWVNDDTFFGDADLGYHTLCVCESDVVYNTNGYIKGLKVRINTGFNVVYDFYYASERAFESNIVVEDVMAFNTSKMVCLKFKSSRAMQSIGRKWQYRPNFVAEIIAANPTLGLSVAGVYADFFSVETQNWHNQPLPTAKDWASRFLTITGADMEIITPLNPVVEGNKPAFNVSITNCHFASFGAGFLNLIRVVSYPHNMYQRLQFSNNIIDCPSADIRAIVNMQKGSDTGGGGFTGAIEIQGNNIRCKSANMLIHFNDTPDVYSNASVNINYNKVHSLGGHCRIAPPDSQLSNYDEFFCQGNTMIGQTVSLGYSCNAANYAESHNTVVTTSSTTSTLWAVGSASRMPIKGGTYVLRVCGNSGVYNNIEFTISSVAGTSTSIQFMSGGSSTTKTTGINNGVFDIATSGSDGFNLNVVVTGTEISIQTSTTARQRYDSLIYIKL